MSNEKKGCGVNKFVIIGYYLLVLVIRLFEN